MESLIKFVSGELAPQPSKVVCVGRNYAKHAAELNNPVPDEPVIFIKPTTTLQSLSDEFLIPPSDCHYETELAILVGERLSGATIDQAESAIMAYGLALDLTKREKQSELKARKLPWELAKSFDGASPISAFVPKAECSGAADLEFRMDIDGEAIQHGRVSDMLFKPAALMAFISETITLLPGDIVLTGTPEGVGELHGQELLSFSLMDCYDFSSRAKVVST